MAAAEKEFDGQTCLKRRTILRLGVPKERGLFTTTSGGRTKASPSGIGEVERGQPSETSQFLRERRAKRIPHGRGAKQGKLPEWPNGADCKSAGVRLRWFESITSHSKKREEPVGVANPEAGRQYGPSRGGLTLIRYIFAEVAQLIEHQPSKLRVASLSLVFRSNAQQRVIRTPPFSDDGEFVSLACSAK